MVRIIGLVFIVFPLLFLAIGGYFAHKQRSRFVTNQPVPATVIDGTVKVNTDSDGDSTYAPVITYRYRVGEREYTSKKTLVVEFSASGDWAHKIVARYPAGTETQAYVNPNDPGDVFLVREATFFPYIFILFPMIFVGVGSALVLHAGKAHHPDKLPQPGASSDGWFTLHSEKRLRSSLLGWALVSGLWCVVGLAAAGHFLSYSENLGLVFLISMGVYSLIAIGLVVMAMMRFRLTRMVGDATLLIDTDPYQLTPGQTVAVFVEQPTRTGMTINRMRLGLIREDSTRVQRGGKTSYSTSIRHKDEQDVTGEQAIQEGRPMQYGRTLVVPEDARPTHTRGDYPRIRWYVTVHTDIAKAPDYKARFPVVVTG